MKAFVVYDGKVLILREADTYRDGTNKGKYDVVGGKVKPGERFSEGLKREVKEETGLDIKIGKPFHVEEWRPVVRGEPFHIVATFFECFADSDVVALSEDHDHYLWINPKEYKNYNIIETNLPAFEAYLNR